VSDESWAEVDRYLAARLVPADPVLEDAVAASAAGGLPPHEVSPLQGKLLHLLARLCDARSILEVGTLGGYSTIWLARALPADGRLVTLELAPAFARVARENVARAGVADRVEIRVGPALHSLEQLVVEGDGPFDLVFLDADKAGTPAYLDRALDLARPGSVIVADNVVRGGAVVNGASSDASVLGVRRFLDRVAAEPRLTATAIQTVGVKGHDGFVVALVTAPPETVG
jgi:predicted O-methyltransferase YrrM